MPVSPSKEKTPKKKSPIRLKMEEAGKKFKKTKKWKITVFYIFFTFKSI